MSDILDDLRDSEGRGPMQHCRAWTELDALQDRAAAEIARLRSCRDDLVAALEAIAQGANESGTGEMALLDTIYAMHALARAALKRAKPAMSEAIICPVCNGRFDEPGSVMCARRHVTPAQFDRLRAAEAAAFRRGVEAMQRTAVLECSLIAQRLWHKTGNPSLVEALSECERAIAALPPPEDKG